MTKERRMAENRYENVDVPAEMVEAGLVHPEPNEDGSLRFTDKFTDSLAALADG